MLQLCLMAAAASWAQNGNATGGVPDHTVSGFSAGADMAVDHFVAFSSVTKGAGVAAGAPYGCKLLPEADTNCGRYTMRVWNGALDKFIQYTNAKAKAGTIDPVANMKSSPVYLYLGADDEEVDLGVMKK